MLHTDILSSEKRSVCLRLVSCVVILFFSLLLLLPVTSTASTIVNVDFASLSRESEFIFEGKVISMETRPSHIDRMPFTYFTLEVIDVIKGSYSGATIELGFAGGTIDGVTMQVKGMQMPQMDETGVFFVEALSTEHINPLYGWHQGHYRVITDPETGTKLVEPSVRDSNALTARPTLYQFKQNIKSYLGN